MLSGGKSRLTFTAATSTRSTRPRDRPSAWRSGSGRNRRVQKRARGVRRHDSIRRLDRSRPARLDFLQPSVCRLPAALPRSPPLVQDNQRARFGWVRTQRGGGERLGRKRGRAATATLNTAGVVRQPAPAALLKPAASGDGGSPVTSPVAHAFDLTSGLAWQSRGCSCFITPWPPGACSRKTRRSTRSCTCLPE